MPVQRASPAAPPDPSPATAAVACAAALTAGLAIALTGLTPLGAGFAAGAIGAFALVAPLVVGGCRAWHPFPRFGGANVVTLGRAVLACLAVGLVAAPDGLAGHPVARWSPFLLAAAALFSDLLDGWLARRQGLCSAFGARFDREVDALLILALSGVAVAMQAVPGWALGIGLLHYLYLAVGVAAPACRRPLPYSLARRLVCGLQVAALGALLAPPLAGTSAAGPVAGAALAALALSFGRDLRWCLLQRAEGPA